MATQSKKPTTGFQPIFKNQVTFRHDLFKAELATMKKNTSWKTGQPRIDEIEHVHHYHSRDSFGRVQKYTNPVGGHFHEITFDPVSGKIECGPALQKTVVKLKSGKLKQTVGPISFYDENREIEIKDDHKHEITYKYSEDITPKQFNQAPVQQLQPTPVTQEEKIAASDF